MESKSGAVDYIDIRMRTVLIYQTARSAVSYPTKIFIKGTLLVIVDSFIYHRSPEQN